MSSARRAVCAAVKLAACAAVLLAAIGLTGCDARSRPAPSATALPQGISATLVSSAAPGEALVRISNDTDDPFEIGWLRVDDPRFARPSWLRARNDQVVAAQTTSLVSVVLPDARCTPGTGDGTRVTVQYEFGASIAVASAPLHDPGGVVAALSAAQCG